MYIDGWAVVDFAGFERMVDSLGGVQMCIPEEMHSEKAQLHLLPGQQVLGGQQALALARARTGEGLGNGSDLMRLGRQHQLLGAIAQGVLSKNLLTDSASLYQFLNAATQSLTTSPELGSIPTLTGLAFSLKDVPSGNIVFMTIPNVANPDDRNEVVWAKDASTVWSAIINDTPIVPPAVATTPAAGTTPGATTPGATTPGATSPGAGTTQPSAPTSTPTPGVDPITADDVSTVCG